MMNQSGLFTRWYQELAGFNFTMVHKKGKKNSKADALSPSTHMAEARPPEEDQYAEFFKVYEPVIRFEGGVNKIQQIQRSLIEITEEQSKNQVWRKVIRWVEDSYQRRWRREVSLGRAFYF